MKLAFNPENVGDASEPLKVLGWAELMALPMVRWRVKHWIPQGAVVVVYGPAGAAKTFLLLDISRKRPKRDR